METDMTREEAIENIKLIRFNAAITNANSFKKALDMAIETLTQSSLPSNLDETADDAMFKFYGMGPHLSERPEYVYTYEQMIAMFKAGAEWMAKQGVSMEVVRGVPWRALDAFIHDHDYTEDSIIQIRKK